MNHDGVGVGVRDRRGQRGGRDTVLAEGPWQVPPTPSCSSVQLLSLHPRPRAFLSECQGLSPAGYLPGNHHFQLGKSRYHLVPGI